MPGKLSKSVVYAMAACFFAFEFAFGVAACGGGGDDGERVEELMASSFEGSIAPFHSDHTSGWEIYPDPTAPDGAYSLRFIFPQGLRSGYPPAVLWDSYFSGGEDCVFIDPEWGGAGGVLQSEGDMYFDKVSLKKIK